MKPKLSELLKTRVGRVKPRFHSAIATSTVNGKDGRQWVTLITLDDEAEMPRVRVVSPDEADELANSLRTLAGATRAHNDQMRKGN